MCEMKGRNGIKMSGDIDWLLKMAEKEDGSMGSVGGLVAAIEEREQMAAILLRTIVAEAERTSSWHVPPDLQERVKAWVAERECEQKCEEERDDEEKGD